MRQTEHNVSYWPIADLQQAPENVGLLGKSRHQNKKASFPLLTEGDIALVRELTFGIRQLAFFPNTIFASGIRIGSGAAANRTAIPSSNLLTN
jgi:hypothetical protein